MKTFLPKKIKEVIQKHLNTNSPIENFNFTLSKVLQRYQQQYPEYKKEFEQFKQFRLFNQFQQP